MSIADARSRQVGRIGFREDIIHPLLKHDFKLRLRQQPEAIALNNLEHLAVANLCRYTKLGRLVRAFDRYQAKCNIEVRKIDWVNP